MLRSDYIILRIPEAKDLAPMLAWENDTSMWHVSDTKVPFSREVLEKYIESTHDIVLHSQLRFVIEHAVDGIALGMLDLFEYDSINSRVGLGILIDHNQRRKGIAKEAIRLAVSYCFEQLHLHQLFCAIGRGNKESQALFESCGFVNHGFKQDWKQTLNSWEDELIYQLIQQ